MPEARTAARKFCRLPNSRIPRFWSLCSCLRSLRGRETQDAPTKTISANIEGRHMTEGQRSMALRHLRHVHASLKLFLDDV
jgi:hypothetical protein